MKVREYKCPGRKFTGIKQVIGSQYRFWSNLYDPLQWVNGNMVNLCKETFILGRKGTTIKAHMVGSLGLRWSFKGLSSSPQPVTWLSKVYKSFIIHVECLICVQMALVLREDETPHNLVASYHCLKNHIMILCMQKIKLWKVNWNESDHQARK